MRLVALVLALTLCLSASVLAYWVAAGDGTGTAAVTATVSGLTITPGSPSGRLLPTGAPSADLTVTIANPNAFPVHVSSLSLDTSQGASGFSANGAGCDLRYTTQSNAGAGWTVSPGGTVDLTLTDAMTMGVSADDACQGRSFDVYLAAS